MRDECHCDALLAHGWRRVEGSGSCVHRRLEEGTLPLLDAFFGE